MIINLLSIIIVLLLMLNVFQDFSMDVREGLHRMLAACTLSTKGCLQMCVESLLDNLKKYPQVCCIVFIIFLFTQISVDDVRYITQY